MNKSLCEIDREFYEQMLEAAEDSRDYWMKRIEEDLKIASHQMMMIEKYKNIIEKLKDEEECAL